MNYSNKIDYYNEIKKITKIVNELPYKKEIDYFSNNNLINHYLILKKYNILYPHGFHVSLSNEKLEKNLFNSLKSIGFKKNNFKEYIENKLSWKSSNNISHISGYKYQFNSIITFFNNNDYTKEELKIINNKKIFLAESVALSKSEINNLVNKFDNFEINKVKKPSIVIVDKTNIDIDFDLSKDYSILSNEKFFLILKLIN